MDEQIQKIKNLLENYVSKGNDINSLSTKNPEYNIIKNMRLSDELGKRLTVAEKIKLAGFHYEPKRKTQDEALSELRVWFDNFIASGGTLSSLRSSDIHYKKLKDMKIKDKNGRQITLEEKFTLMGLKRAPKHNDYESISNILDNLSFYEDENGFVDSYRKDKKMCYHIDLCSSVYKLPPSLIISLLADKKLKKYYLNIDRAEYLRYELSKFIENNGNLIGLKTINPRLYEQLISYKRSYPTKSGHQISMQQLVDDLGFMGIPSSFLSETNAKAFDENEFFYKYGPTIKKNNNQISITDIESQDYNRLTEFLRRCDISLNDYFAQYKISYITPKNASRNNLVSTEHYPFLEEMKKERDTLIEDYFSKYPKMENTGKANLFLIKLQACQFVYEKYRPIILETYTSGETPPEKQTNN